MRVRTLGVTTFGMMFLLWAAILGAASGDVRLIDAVERRDHESVRALLQDKADVNAAQPDGTTALVYRQLPGDAFDYSFRQPGANGNKEVADLLLSLGAAPFTGKYRDRSAE